MNQNSQDLAISLPIPPSYRQLAQSFSQQQPTPEKANQVLANTLAVLVVNDWLQMMGIPTDLAASDSWNPVVRMSANVADLTLVGYGRLECRPLLFQSLTCHIPLEVWDDRIGYVGVAINDNQREGKILGFVAQATVAELPIRYFQPPEVLLEKLHQSPVQLSQWLNQVFTTGWQALEEVLNPQQTQLTFNFRHIQLTPAENLIRRAKILNFEYPVALVVERQPQDNAEVRILIQVYPIGDRLHLPASLSLALLDADKRVLREVIARSSDNYIQLQFTGIASENFSVRVKLADSSILENFVI